MAAGGVNALNIWEKKEKGRREDANEKNYEKRDRKA